MKTPAVQEFCERLWELRERRAGEPRKLARSLIFAIEKDFDAHAGYNPACDSRVEWALWVLRERARTEEWKKAPAVLEAVVEMLLGKGPSLMPAGCRGAQGE